MTIKHFPLLLLSTASLVSSSLLPAALSPVQATSHLPNIPSATIIQTDTVRDLTNHAPQLLAQDALPILRRGDSGNQAGTISEIATTYSNFGGRQHRVITAVRTAENRIKLISWDTNGDGSVIRTGDSGNQAGQALQINIAGGSAHDGTMVTAVRTDSGNLKLISWQRDRAGNMTRLGDSDDQAGKISLVKIEEIFTNTYVTAVRTAEGTLKLITWQLNPDGSLTRLGDSGNQAGSVSEISLSRLSFGDPRKFTTAVRDDEGNLKLIVWGISGEGEVIRIRDSGNQAGQARMIQLVQANEDYLVTSLRTANGQLKLITWAEDLSRVSDSGDQAGGNNLNGANALMSHPHKDGVVSAVRTDDGHLKVIGWDVTRDG